MNENTPRVQFSASQRVVKAIAEYKGVEPAALTPPLYEEIDPDALDSLFTPRKSDCELSIQYIIFNYQDMRVRVGSDKTVEITKQK